MTTPSIISALKKLQTFLSPKEKKQWFAVVLFALVSSALEVFTASTVVIFAQVLNQPQSGEKYLHYLGLSQGFYGNNINGNNISANHIILFFALICTVAYFAKSIIAAIEVFYQNRIIQKINYNFKNKLLQHYAEMDFRLYLSRNSSYNAAIVEIDGDRIFSTGLVSVANILSESIVFFCLIGMIIFMNPSLAFSIFAIGGLLTFIVVKKLLPMFYRWGQKLQQAAVLTDQHLTQFFHGFKEIVLHGKREFFIDRFQAHSFIKSKIQAVQTATNAMPRIVLELCFVSIFMITISLMCLRGETSQEMIGTLGGYLYIGFRLMPGLNRIIGQLNILKSIVPSIDRVYSEYNTQTFKKHYQEIPEFRFNDVITFDAVSYKYSENYKEVLNKINLQIKKGECIGIIGETGCGKSTLSDLLLGLLKPAEGKITVDDQFPVQCYQWHQQIGYVSQTLYLLDDTIAANIVFGENPEEIDQTRLKAALEDAQLSQFIERLPEGLNTRVGERGICLSGGERQRIAIARALYRNPAVLILDEATSALDNETESKLMECFKLLRKNRTVIMIAHRWSTLKECDRILSLKAGEIAEELDYQTLKLRSETPA